MTVDAGFVWWSFALANSVNIVVALMFWARMRRPVAEDRFATASMLLGIPAALLAAAGITSNQPPMAWLVVGGWAVFALMTWIVDHVVEIEFRQPKRLGILVPFLVLFYLPLLGMAIVQLTNGVVPWAITSTTFLIAFSLSLWSTRSLGY